MKYFFFALILCIASWPTHLLAQEIAVQLTERTTDDSGGMGLEPLREAPREILILPDVDITKARFMEEFYSHDVEDDAAISIMVLFQEEGELLYIDINNDEDLTNDGPPRRFPADVNTLVFYIQAHTDSLQKTGRRLKRTPGIVFTNPEARARHRENVIDEEGNLQPQTLRHWRIYHPELDGRKGTFYYDEYVDLSRGKVVLEGKEYLIGLKDVNQDGLFNNDPSKQDRDKLYIDLNQNGKLSILETTEIFELDTIIEVAGASYEITHIDPYGRSLRLQKVHKNTADYYLQATDTPGDPAASSMLVSGDLDASFWDLVLETIEGETISMRHFKGRYILLNFWGEWCIPCYQEMPDLVAAHAKIGQDQLQMISMLLTYDLKAAKEVMREHHLSWPQVQIDEEVEQRFRVQGYPTNILIYPDGKRLLKTGRINAAFFEQYIR